MLEIEQVKQESKRIKKEVKKQTIGYILAAMGLIAGLAWNDAVKSLIETFFQNKNSISAKFIYAAIITAAVVGVGIYLARMSEERDI